MAGVAAFGSGAWLVRGLINRDSHHNLLLYASSAAVLMGTGDGTFNTVGLTRLAVLSEERKMLTRSTAFVLFQCINVIWTAGTFFLLSVYHVADSDVVFYLLAGFSAATVVFVAAAPLVTFAPDTMVEDKVPGVQEND